MQQNLYMLRILPAQGKLVLQQVTYLKCKAWLPRNFIQSEVSIHTTCDNLIQCCKTGLNVGDKKSFAAMLQNKLQVSDARFTVA